MERLRLLSLLAAGGALGAVSRYGAAALVARVLGERFPWGTFVVNASGCLALGFVLTVTGARLPESRTWIPLVAVGFLGAYTTFSTFSWEVLLLLRQDAWLRASAYALGSVAVGLLAVRAGAALAEALA